MRSARVFALILSCVLAMVPVLPSAGQASPRPWVLVSVPATPEGETRSEILAEVIADTVELTLRLVGRYVLQSRPSVPVNPASDAEAASLSHELSLDYLVYGRVEEVDASTTRFSLSVYSREQEGVVLSRQAVANSLFETFEVADALTAELLEAFTGQRIAYGSIELVNEAPLAGRYHVRVDGEPMGDTVSLLERVLVGPRELEIVGADGKRIQERIVVEEGALHRVSFSLTAEEPPRGTGHLLAQPEPPAPEEEEPELTLTTEPPFAWRAYAWSRTDPGRREGLLWTTTFHLTREERPGWDSQGWGGGLTTRMDWGRRHSLLLEYSRVAPNWLDPDEGDGDHEEFYADDVTAETVLTYRPQDVYRLATGYGVRLEPTRGITIMPWWRVALERDARRAVYREESGAWLPVSFRENQDRATTVPEVPTGELFWNVVTGPALVVAGSLRRASLYVGGGVSRIIPLSRDYSAQVTVTPYDIDEDRVVPVVGTIDPEWGWHLSLGAGYSWGGSERTVNEAYSRVTGKPRPYESYPPARAPYGVSVAPSFGAPVFFAPKSNRGTLSFPSPALSLEYARPGGRLLEITAFSSPPTGRASRVLEQPVGEAEPLTINSDIRSPVMGVRLGIARRRAMSDRITMSLGYHLSPVFQTMGEEFRPLVEALGMAGIGPTVSVAHAPEGSRAIVFGSLVLHTPIPLGPTLYSAGLDEHDTEDGPGDTAYRTVDGHTDRPPMAVASFGVRLRVAGTPARILAAPARTGARDSGTAGPAPPPDSEPTAEHRRRWWQPVAVVGVGFALPVADNPAEGTLYSGVLTTVPLALRFPFGGELGLEGTFPVSRRGISAPEAPFPILNTTNQYGTFQIPMDAEPRLNRLTSVEAGYRLRRDHALSLRPAIRYTWADLELWAIESRLQDGTLLAPGDEHFTRVDPVHFLGASVEAAWEIRPALSLRATASASWRISAATTEVTPPFAPTVEVSYPDSLVTFGIATTVEM